MNGILDDRNLERFKDLIYEKLGIHFSGKKNYILEAKLNRILMHKHIKDLDEFYKSLKDGDKEAIELLVRYMTTNHTYFFREKDHFEILKNLIKNSKQKNNMIWCAASSTGEEVYSILIYLLEENLKQFKIVASDINLEVLRHLHRGIYHGERLSHVNEYFKYKYFTRKENGYYQVKPHLKDFLVIKKINLVDHFDFEEKIDYVFCRNVMIYFDTDTRIKVLKNIIRNMKEKAYLFLGYSENIFNLTDKVKTVSNSVYQKK